MKRHTVLRRSIGRAASILVATAVASGFPALGLVSAQAQQMGNQPWGFSGRNPSLAAQFDYQRRNGGLPGGGAGGLGALHQYVTTYNSTSTSIGNLNEITQNLSGGSTGTVDQNTSQDSQGNQSSDAETEVTQTNTVNSTNSSDGSPSNEEETSTAQN